MTQSSHWFMHAVFIIITGNWCIGKTLRYFSPSPTARTRNRRSFLRIGETKPPSAQLWLLLRKYIAQSRADRGATSRTLFFFFSRAAGGGGGIFGLQLICGYCFGESVSLWGLGISGAVMKWERYCRGNGIGAPSSRGFENSGHDSCGRCTLQERM